MWGFEGGVFDLLFWMWGFGCGVFDVDSWRWGFQYAVFDLGFWWWSFDVGFSRWSFRYRFLKVTFSRWGFVGGAMEVILRSGGIWFMSFVVNTGSSIDYFFQYFARLLIIFLFRSTIRQSI